MVSRGTEERAWVMTFIRQGISTDHLWLSSPLHFWLLGFGFVDKKPKKPLPGPRSVAAASGMRLPAGGLFRPSSAGGGLLLLLRPQPIEPVVICLLNAALGSGCAGSLEALLIAGAVGGKS